MSSARCPKPFAVTARHRGLFLASVTVPSWSDHKRSTERRTDSDRQLITAALSHTVTGAAEDERRLFAVGTGPVRRPARAGSTIDQVGEANGTAEREELRHGSTVEG
jgi:hypothetical protein